MDYLAIQEDALIEISRIQRAAWLGSTFKVVEMTADEVARDKKLKRESYRR